MSWEEISPWLEKALDIVQVIEVVLLSVIANKTGKTEKAVTDACSTPIPEPVEPKTVDPVGSVEPAPVRLKEKLRGDFEKALDVYFSSKETAELDEREVMQCAAVTRFLEDIK